MGLTIDWVNFAMGSALLGGVMLGVGASLLLIFSGKIAGISGIVAYLINPNHSDRNENAWRALFLIVAGLLVGFGSRMGSGCTSGHGICGLSRLSLRSLVATLSFMLSGFALTYVMLHTS